MNSKLMRYTAALIYMALLAWVSLKPLYAPGETPGAVRQLFHNLLHIPAYAVLTFLWLRCFVDSGIRRGWDPAATAQVKVAAGSHAGRADLWAAGAIALGYGILMEFLQGLTPNRYPSLMDVGLNAIGVGMIICYYFRKSAFLMIKGNHGV